MTFRERIADFISGGKLTLVRQHNAVLADVARSYDPKNDPDRHPLAWQILIAHVRYMGAPVRKEHQQERVQAAYGLADAFIAARETKEDEA